MDDPQRSVLKLNLTPEMINYLYNIIYGVPPSTDPDDIYDYTFNTNYYTYENNKGLYLLYRNAFGFKALTEVNIIATKVLNYIDNLLNQLKSKPEFWTKIADQIRKQPYDFNPKLVYVPKDPTDIVYASNHLIQAPLSQQNLRVYALNSVNTFTGDTTIPEYRIDNAQSVSRIKGVRPNLNINGSLDTSIFGPLYKGLVYNDVTIDNSGTLQEKLKVIFTKPTVDSYKTLLRYQGYYYKSDLTILLQPDFLNKVFNGALYVDVKDAGYVPVLNFKPNL
ncbi:hypothetical protein [Nostoc sp.]|uniref:hypothetical protein n=1 Tax=Nostoc sp. TaxID=1180 RepID=UPI002FFB4218